MSFEPNDWLNEQLNIWQTDGLVTHEQAGRIRSRYPAQRTEQRSSKLGKPFAVLGGLLMSVGLVLFFSSNWRAIPDAGKLLIVFSGILGAYGVAYRKRFGPAAMPGLSSGFFFAGAIAYGAGIFLVAQIYNLQADWRTGLLLWGGGVLPLAYAVKTRPVLWLAWSVFLTWLMIEFRFPETFLLCQGAGVILMLAGLLHAGDGMMGRVRRIYLSLGAGFLLFSLLTMGFEGFELHFQRGNSGQEFLPFVWTLATLYLGLQVVVLLVLRKRRENASILLVMCLPLMVVPGVFALAGHSSNLPFAIGVNLLMAAACVGLMFYAVAVRSKPYLNLAAVAFLMLVTVRYFDTAWEYLPRSLFFICGGLLLLGLGYLLEKKRRKWVSGFVAEGAP